MTKVPLRLGASAEEADRAATPSEPSPEEVSGIPCATGLRHPFGPNVEQILAQATRVIRGRIPIQVRKELVAAVKAGVLGRIKKDGLKPEIFFHPDHKNGAVERQAREAAYSVSCIASVIGVKPVGQRIEEAIASLPRGGA